MIKKAHPDKWWFYAILVIVFAVLFWMMAIRAIDTGSLLQYTIAAVLLIISIKELVNLIRSLIKK